MTDSHPPDADPLDPTRSSGHTASLDELPVPDIQEIGSASRSCLVILALAVVIVLLVCVSWLTRILF